jgi:ribonuclease J
LETAPIRSAKGILPSERTVGVALENIFRDCDSRILIATFSSNVHRVQKFIDTAVMFNRKVAISGRSMVNVVSLATELGYLKIPPNVLVDINKTKNIKDSELVIITTGSQGEPMSALSRMATSDHKAIQIKKGDVVILSSSPIPGNEKTVSNVVNRLFEKGADVIYSDIADIHVSGHACEEELKLIHMLIKPKYFMPVHGEYRHLRQHAKIAESLGMPNDHIFILANGETLSLKKNQVVKTKETVPSSPVMVDGLGVGDVGNIVLRDRKLLSEGGLIIVVAAIDKASGIVTSGPDIISRGFVYVRESEDLIESARKVAEDRLARCRQENVKDWGAMKNAVRTDLQNFITNARSVTLSYCQFSWRCKMNVYDQAHALARALKEAPEYQGYMELKAKVSENDDLSASINDFQQKQFQLQAQQMLGGEMQTDMMEQIQSLYQILAKDPLAAQYLQAEFAFTRLVSEVYGILGEVIKVDSYEK